MSARKDYCSCCSQSNASANGFLAIDNEYRTSRSFRIAVLRKAKLGSWPYLEICGYPTAVIYLRQGTELFVNCTF